MLAALEPEVSECLSENGGIQAGDHVPENPELECWHHFVGIESDEYSVVKTTKASAAKRHHINHCSEKGRRMGYFSALPASDTRQGGDW